MLMAKNVGKSYKSKSPHFLLGAFSCLKRGAEGQSRTDTGSPPLVFETSASTISPLRHIDWYYTICLAGFGSA